jgi:CheY-like chemotaxis protein
MAVAVPLIAEPTDPKQAADQEDARPTDKVRAQDRRPRRIALVVDDSEDAQLICREVLEEEGFWVHTAGNGLEALDLLFTIPTPTIIVLDLLMPKMDGHEVLDVIRAYRRLAEVPVLIVTASDTATSSAPRVDLLRKPIVGDALADRIRSLLGESIH